MLTLFRVIIGFIVACLVAGLVQVAFVITPFELASLPGEAFTNRLTGAAILSLAAATQSAIFAAPFAFIAILVGEWQSLRHWFFYAFFGAAIALAGFAAQYASEVSGQPTIVNEYALAAYVVTGLCAGLAYWMFSGSKAGRPPAHTPPAIKNEPVNKSPADGESGAARLHVASKK